MPPVKGSGVLLHDAEVIEPVIAAIGSLGGIEAAEVGTAPVVPFRRPGLVGCTNRIVVGDDTRSTVGRIDRLRCHIARLRLHIDHIRLAVADSLIGDDGANSKADNTIPAPTATRRSTKTVSNNTAIITNASERGTERIWRRPR